MVAGETNLLLLGTNTSSTTAVSSTNSNTGSGGGGGGSTADPVLLRAQRRARTQLAAEQAKENQRLNSQLAVTQALLAPVRWQLHKACSHVRRT